MAWSFKDVAVAESVINDIRNGKIANSATAYSILTQIMNDLPGTSVAKEAEILRESI